VKVTRPATSWNAAESPAVAAGTASATGTLTVPWAGTVTDAGSVRECGLPASLAWLTSNVAGDEPKLRRVTLRVAA